MHLSILTHILNNVLSMIYAVFQGENQVMETITTVKVVVTYPAAAKPFETDAERTETEGQLKAAVLTAFGLTEGQLPGGNVATYTLYDGKTPLENPNQTLGEIAGHREALHFKLAQQIVQGADGR